jgi:FixJ family two-component response regulator
MMTGHGGDVQSAVRAMKNGALDFIEKPYSDDARPRITQREIREMHARRSSLCTGRIHRRACRLGLRPIPLLVATRSAVVGSGSAAVGMATSLVIKSDAGWRAAF